MTGRTARRRVLRVSAPGGVPPDPRADLLAVEEPLEIRVAGQPLSVTMRTPGDDLDLTAGFLAAEGIIAAPADLAGITMCAGNVAEVTLAPGVSLPLHQLRRNFLTSSACGVCGKDSIDAIRLRSRYDVSADPLRITPATLAGLPGRCAPRSGCSPAPVGCTPRGCSRPTARCWSSARTWAGTTRWTR